MGLLNLHVNAIFRHASQTMCGSKKKEFLHMWAGEKRFTETYALKQFKRSEMQNKAIVICIAYCVLVYDGCATLTREYNSYTEEF